MVYRSDVDGLRAVAVLSVLLFHAEVKVFSGGYVGVDVFFVISGFLITGMVFEAATERRFSFARFYERRVRRLFPAALTTLILTSVAATALFAADHLKAFGASLLHAAISASNFYFWSQSDYFEPDATLKPLLHTWSLAVEEQFYLIWPALVALLATRLPRAFWWIVAGLGCVSLGASVLVMREDSAAAFFLMPLRVWEFCLGALAVCGTRVRLPAWLKEASTLSGLGLIVWAVLSYRQDTPFPGVHALPPTVGAVLTILGGNPRYAGLLLRNPLALLIGKISYSAYLVHWPLLVFLEYRWAGRLTPSTQAGVVLASLVAGWLMWRFVEEPYRYPERKSRPLSATGFGLVCASVSLALAVGAAHLWTSGGWRRPTKASKRVLDYIAQQWEAKNAFIEVGSCYLMKTGKYDREHCLKKAVDRPNYLVIGDSYAAAVFSGLKQHLGDEAEVSLLGTGACKPLVKPSSSRRTCRVQCQMVFEELDLAPYDIIFLSGFFDSIDAVHQLPEAVRTLRARGAREVVVFGSPTTYTASVEDTFKALSDVPNKSIYARISKQVDEPKLEVDAVAKSLDMQGGTYLSMIDVLCPDGTSASCRHALPSGMPIIADKGHITLDGAVWVLRELEARAAPWRAKGRPGSGAGND